MEESKNLKQWTKKIADFYKQQEVYNIEIIIEGLHFHLIKIKSNALPSLYSYGKQQYLGIAQFQRNCLSISTSCLYGIHTTVRIPFDKIIIEY